MCVRESVCVLRGLKGNNKQMCMTVTLMFLMSSSD